MTDVRTVDAIVLAGGAGRRMGNVDKPGLTVGRVSLVRRVVDAVAGARSIVVVGPHRDDLDADIVQTRESPPGSGPVAAIAAGLAALPIPDADVVVVLAGDLPFATSADVDALVDGLGSRPALFAEDRDGRTQFLFGAWNADELRRRTAALDTVADAPVRSVVPPDHGILARVDVDDCDTRADLAQARMRFARERRAATRDRAPSLDQARTLIRERIPALPSRNVALGDAYGSTLAAPVVAVAALPPVNISAMDGYAVAGDEPWTLRADVAYAGTSGLPHLSTGQAVRIATGAQVPTGADSVIRDEHVEVRGDALTRRAGSPVRNDTRHVGEDWSAGTELVPAGVVVSAAVTSVALSGEVTDVSVRGPVTVRVLVSGNEIRAEGVLEPGQTRDSIGPVLHVFARACGMTQVDAVHLDDSPTAFDYALTGPIDVDVVLVVGATGGGAADRLRSALARADADIVVDRVAIRPGGSQLTAVLDDGTVVIGLPGNPLAAVSTLMTTGPAIVDALTCRSPEPTPLGVLTDYAAMTSPVPRVVPVIRDGEKWRHESGFGTAHLRHLVVADALALIPADVTPDELVELIPLPRP